MATTITAEEIATALAADPKFKRAKHRLFILPLLEQLPRIAGTRVNQPLNCENMFGIQLDLLSKVLAPALQGLIEGDLVTSLEDEVRDLSANIPGLLAEQGLTEQDVILGPESKLKAKLKKA